MAERKEVKASGICWLLSPSNRAGYTAGYGGQPVPVLIAPATSDEEIFVEANGGTWVSLETGRRVMQDEGS